MLPKKLDYQSVHFIQARPLPIYYPLGGFLAGLALENITPKSLKPLIYKAIVVRIICIM